MQRAQSPHIIAIIPARGGSKRIPHKNLLPIAGRPLVVHSIVHALQSSRVREVYVSTESEEIAAVARAHGAEVVKRPPELSGDEATSESALRHVLDERNRRGLPDPDLVVFLQCTSPVRRRDDIDRAVETLLAEGADSLFSACENNRLIWALKDGRPYSVNYDYLSRQREQDMTRQYRENGSIYVFRPEVLREHGNRLGGRIAVYEMDYWSSFQIDAAEHAEVIEWVMRRPGYGPEPEWPTHVRLVVFDFDGVMTDNTVLVDVHGGETVRCDRGDGWGIARLRDAGVPMAVLSTEEHPVVAARCAKLKLPCVQGSGDKAASLAALLTERGIEPADVIYVGNDVNDLGCLRMVGMPVAVGDAHPEVMAASKLVLTRDGGRGAVREFCDLLLAALSGAHAPRIAAGVGGSAEPGSR
jgi:YrbI family 3-deoxy-D-manno-octulosonate 8-phosphate phosphatase